MPRMPSFVIRRLPLLLLPALFGASACAGSVPGTGETAPAPAGAASAAADSAAAPVPAPAPPRAARPSASDDPFQRLVGEAEHMEGLFDLYRTKDDKLYMAIPAERLGRDFLMEYKLARGIGAGGLYGGTMLSIFEGHVMTFRKQGENLYLVRQPHRFRAEPGTPQEAAVELSFTPSIVETAKIEATRGDSLQVHLIEVTSWFVGDLAGMSQRLRGLTATGPAPGPGPPPSFDRTRSYLESVKAFPRNLNIRTVLTYRAPQPISQSAVSDGRYLTMAVHHTLAELPEEPMEPREADDRVGFFITAHKDFTGGDDSFFVRHINRWRLECDESAEDGLCDPVKPIVYYLDRTIPEEYHRFFQEGIEAWQPAFEEAGFREAIRAELLPADADPDDLRFPTLRWNTSDQPGYSAIGPSVVDPRTGEILDANQLYEANMILGFRAGWRNLVEPQQALELALGVVDGDPEKGLEALMTHQHMAGILSDQGTFLRTLLAARGEIGAGEALPEEYMGEAIRWVVMHEVGHTLGLRHNFRSSTDTPIEHLHDREWALERGLVSSVMDYHAPNVAHDGEAQGHFYSPGVGSADRWKIAYGYTPDPARALELARLAEDDGRTYGADEDSAGPGAMDPSVNTFDLSGDPLAWGIARTDMIARLWETLPEIVLQDNARYADLTSAFQTLLGQYSQALAPAVKYVGGEYVYRTRPGDAADRGPFVPVSRERQHEALEFLARRAFGEEAFHLPPEMLASFGPDRWSHWGATNTHQGRIDFPFHERVSALQRILLSQVVNPFRLARMRDAELRYGAGEVLTIPELMETLSETVWSEVWAGTPRSVSSLRRDLQRSYLDLVTGLVVDPPARLPADARSVARSQLRDLDGRLQRALRSGSGLDAYTRAHLGEARAWIGKSLEAGIRAER